jgi:hypothetical protein
MKICSIITESGHTIKLGDLVHMSKDMKDADFWIEYRGSINTVGKPSKEYGPHKLGIKVIATDILDPTYLYYVFMHLHNQGQFARIANGTTNLVNIRIRDVANIPLAISESISENDDAPIRIRLRGNEDTAKRWIKTVYAQFPENPLNYRQHIMSFSDDEYAVFELEPSFSQRGAVEVKWISAHPLRKGVGSKAMKTLTDLAQNSNITLTLYPWDKGEVSQADLKKFYAKQGFKGSSEDTQWMKRDPLKENDSVTFAGKNPREFTSPNGGKAAMVIVTAQGSRYLITDDGMVLRHKSAHANTGGEDQGIKNWSQHIEFYDPTDKVGGTTFPLAVSAAVSKNIPVALSKTPDGRRALAILDNGKWRVAKISDVFKHVATDDVPIVGKYSTSPKLHWHTMDYDINNNGMLSRVHPGSPVSHGAAVKHSVNEDDDDYGIDRTPDVEGAKQYIQDVKRDFDSFGELPVNGVMNDLEHRYNLDNATIGELLEPIKSDIVIYINTMLGQGGHSIYGALRRIYKLHQYDVNWPEIRRMLDTNKRRIIKYMLDKIKVHDVGVVQEQLRHLKDMGIVWPELVHIGSSVAVQPRILENDYADRYSKMRDDLKQKVVAAFEQGPEKGFNYLVLLNLKADEVQGARAALEKHKHEFIRSLIKLLKGTDGSEIGLARNTAYKFQNVGMKWPELDIIIKTGNDYFDDELRKSVEHDRDDQGGEEHDRLNEIGPAIDNVHGLGAVGISGNINYMGLRVYVKPSVFLKLAARHPNLDTSYHQQHMASGAAIGAPFLDIHIPSEWIDESSRHDKVVEGNLTDPATIIGHEGRHRMAAILKEYGDVPIETHLLFRGFRRRHITDNMVERLNQDIFTQEHKLYQGPWFSLTDTVTETTEHTDSSYMPLDIAQLKELLTVVRNEQETVDDRSMFSNTTGDDEQQYRALTAIEYVIKNNIKALNNPTLQPGSIFVYDWEYDDEIGAIQLKVVGNVAELKWLGSYNSSGKQLMKQGLAHAKAMGATKVNLTSKWGSAEYYKKQGFTPVTDVADNPITDVGADFTKEITEAVDIDFVDRNFLTDIKHYGILVALSSIANRFDRDTRFNRDTSIYSDTLNKHRRMVIQQLLMRIRNAENSRTEFEVIASTISSIVKHMRINWPEFNVILQSCKAHMSSLPNDNPYDELDEKWSKKYKNSINCSNPKGFSQRAHCAGKKR